MKTIILTGTSSGLGKSIFEQLFNSNNNLVSISRRFLEEQKESSKIELIEHDLKETEQLVDKIKKSSLISSAEELIFINNAGVVVPIDKIGKLKVDAIKDATTINFTCPAIITNYLCSLNKKLKIIHIGTGAATDPRSGWSMYCSTKAAIKMFFDVINKEGTSAENIDPGVINTNLQTDIRNANFSTANYFVDLQKNEKLKDPVEVAKKIITEQKLL